jgi:hypothetical protein
MPGGWEAIPDVMDPHIQELGSWAVAEHTKETNEGLTFIKVVSGKQQVVSGMNYRLIIEMANGPTSNSMYDVVVYEQSRQKSTSSCLSPSRETEIVLLFDVIRRVAMWSA